MNIEIYEKPVVIKFVMVDGVEFELSELICVLDQLLGATKENDKYGDYSLRAYELYDYDITNKLVQMGLVNRYIGSRMAELYCMKDEVKIQKLLDTLSLSNNSVYEQYDYDCRQLGLSEVFTTRSQSVYEFVLRLLRYCPVKGYRDDKHCMFEIRFR